MFDFIFIYYFLSDGMSYLRFLNLESVLLNVEAIALVPETPKRVSVPSKNVSGKAKFLEINIKSILEFVTSLGLVCRYLTINRPDDSIRHYRKPIYYVTAFSKNFRKPLFLYNLFFSISIIRQYHIIPYIF